MSKPIKIGDKWQGRVRKVGQPSVSANFDTYAAANNFIIKTTAEMLSKKHVDIRQVKKTTIGSLIDDYNHVHANEEFGKNKTAVLKSLRRDLGEVLVPHFTVDRLMAYIRQRKKDGAGGVTIALDLSYLRTVLQMARQLNGKPIDIQVIADAKANFKYIGLSAKSNQRDRRPTDDEIKRIKSAFAKKSRQKIPMPDIIDFAISTAMRSAEICRLRWCDLNETDKTVLIRDRKHPTKKKGNHQVVPLLEDAWKIAMAQPRISDRIFPYNEKTISSIFPRAVQACEIEDLRYHDLRHEGISRLFEDGYQIHEVAVFSGHLDWQQLKRYTHIRAKNLHRDRFGNLRREVQVVNIE